MYCSSDIWLVGNPSDKLSGFLVVVYGQVDLGVTEVVAVGREFVEGRLHGDEIGSLEGVVSLPRVLDCPFGIDEEDGAFRHALVIGRNSHE